MIDSNEIRAGNANRASFHSARGGRARKEKEVDARTDSFEKSVKETGSSGPHYPLMTEKLFGSLDKMEKAISSLSDKPTAQEVQKSEVRNIARWIVVLSEAYSDSYDPKELKHAVKPFHDLAYEAGQYKDADLVESEAKALFPTGQLPPQMEKDIAQLKQDRAKEFNTFLKKFRGSKLGKALEILRNPSPLDEGLSPEKIAKQDRRRLAGEAEALIDRISEVGLFHDDPEEFHDGRKCLRNLYAFKYITDDVFDYKKEDVDALFHLFTRYGEAQDKHIAQLFFEENGYETESKAMLRLQKALRKNAMDEAESFLASGTLESIRETVNS